MSLIFVHTHVKEGGGLGVLLHCLLLLNANEVLVEDQGHENYNNEVMLDLQFLF